jgi:hypothetical protein
VKKCTSCTKDIPDTAIHCVFCGAKQGPPQVAGPAQKTIMGYAPAELAKLMPTPGAGGPLPGPPPGPPSGSLGTAATMYAGGGLPGAPPPGVDSQRTVMAGMAGGPPPPMGGPPPPVGAEQRTMMAGMGGAPAAPLPPMAGGRPMGPPQMGPPPMGPPQMGPGASAPPPMMQPPPMQQPVIQSPHVLPPPMQPRVGSAYMPQHGGGTSSGPIEPWGGSLRLMMVVFGIVFLLTLFGPLTLSPLRFGFEGLSHLTGKALVGTAYLGVGALLLVLFGLMPVATNIRGMVAAAFGVGTIVLLFAGIMDFSRAASSGGLPFSGWTTYLLFTGLAIGPAGLLLRSAYPDAAIGRLIGVVGCAAVAVLFVIPIQGQVLLVGMFRSLPHIGEIGAQGVVMLLLMLVLFLASVIGLVACLLPGEATAGAGLWARVLIFWFFVMSAVALVISMGASIFKAPLAIYAVVDMAALFALPAYGIATVFGKMCEE